MTKKLVDSELLERAIEALQYESLQGFRDGVAGELRAALSAPQQEAVVVRPIQNYEDIYSVSSDGAVTNIKTGRKLKPSVAGRGYQFVTLWKNNKGTQFYVHRLVASAFLDREPGKDEVNHVDGNKKNNCVKNLEWCDRSHNARHARHVLNLPSGGLPAKEIVSVDLATSETKIYPSVEAAVRDGHYSSHINKCINDTTKTHHGKIWRLHNPHPAPSVPEGWQLVPKEPTQEMMAAHDNLLMQGVPRGRNLIYRAMLSAAPKAPTTDDRKDAERLKAAFHRHRKACHLHGLVQPSYSEYVAELDAAIAAQKGEN